MIKHILIATLLLTVTMSFGQNKWQEKQSKHFVEAAVKEYNLNEAQHAELIEIRATLINTYNDLNTQEKEGELSKEEKKERTQNANNEYHSGLAKMTGKTYKELEPFLARMREELKNLK